MAFLPIQTVHGVQVLATVNTVIVAPTGVGNLVVVHIRVSNPADNCTSVIDDKGNTYILSASVTSTAKIYQAYGVQVIGGATSITANFTTAQANIISMDEYSGGLLTNASVFDVSSTGVGASVSSLNVTAFAPSLAGELIVATLASSSSKTFTAGSGFTLYSNGTTLCSQYKLSASASETAPFTVSSSDIGLSEIASAFKSLILPLNKKLLSLGVGT